ncbi:MAG: DUF169 domain-containing protein [Andreesenia angusta]|nr:DUF169 domain-containing protein [Andreesenia angusta]
MDKYFFASEKMKVSLEIEREIIGVRFLKTEDQFNKSKAKKIRSKMPYCVMVKLASSGYHFKGNLSSVSCKGAIKALSLDSYKKETETGEDYYSFGLYRDLDIAKEFATEMIYLEDKNYGIEVGALEKLTEEPDVVIIVTTPYNIMRIIQGYSYKFGHNDNYRISGNQAICSECTAVPYLKNGMNVTMMCSGTRYSAGWKEEEMAVGFSREQFIEVADGVYKSINGAETNRKKNNIIKKIKESNLEEISIEINDAYFIRTQKKAKEGENKS